MAILGIVGSALGLAYPASAADADASTWPHYSQTYTLVMTCTNGVCPSLYDQVATPAGNSIIGMVFWPDSFTANYARGGYWGSWSAYNYPIVMPYADFPACVHAPGVDANVCDGVTLVYQSPYAPSGGYPNGLNTGFWSQVDDGSSGTITWKYKLLYASALATATPAVTSTPTPQQSTGNLLRDGNMEYPTLPGSGWQWEGSGDGRLANSLATSLLTGLSASCGNQFQTLAPSSSLMPGAYRLYQPVDWPGGMMVLSWSGNATRAYWSGDYAYVDVLVKNTNSGQLIYQQQHSYHVMSGWVRRSVSLGVLPAGRYEFSWEYANSMQLDPAFALDDVWLDHVTGSACSGPSATATPRPSITRTPTNTPTPTGPTPTGQPTQGPAPSGTATGNGLRNCDFEAGMYAWSTGGGSIQLAGGPAGPQYASLPSTGSYVEQSFVASSRTFYLTFWARGFGRVLVNGTEAWRGNNGSWGMVRASVAVASAFQYKIRAESLSGGGFSVDGVAASGNTYIYCPNAHMPYTPTPGSTAYVTVTPSRTPTAGPSPTPTDTPIPPMLTETPTPRPTSTPVPSSTPRNTVTPYPSETFSPPELTATAAAQFPATHTPYPTYTPLPTYTQPPPEQTATAQGTSVPTYTPPPSYTPPATYTPYPTYTQPAPQQTATAQGTSVPTYTPPPCDGCSDPTATQTGPEQTATALGTAVGTYTPNPTYTSVPGGGGGTATPGPGGGGGGTATPGPGGGGGAGEGTCEDNVLNCDVPPQPEMECLRPTVFWEVAMWIDYSRCEVLKYFAWSDDNSEQLEQLGENIDDYEPFGAASEVVLAVQTVNTLTTSYDWINTGYTGAWDVQRPSIVESGQTWLAGSNYSFAPNQQMLHVLNVEIDYCSARMITVFSTNVVYGVCVVWAYLHTWGIVAWVQFFFDLAVNLMLVRYLWRYLT